MLPRTASAVLVLVLMFWGAGCSAPRQSAGELNAGLLSVVPSNTIQDWPLAAGEPVRLERSPQVVVAWSHRPTGDGDARPRPTKTAREGWIAAITHKLQRSGRVASASGTAPDLFDDGVTVEGVRRLAEDRRADVVVVFAFDVKTRRYHAFEPLSDRPGAPADVESHVEIVTLAHAVGFTAAGVPIFTDTERGFASGLPERRSFEELAATSHRVAVDALADGVVARLRLIAPEAGRK